MLIVRALMRDADPADAGGALAIIVARADKGVADAVSAGAAAAITIAGTFGFLTIARVAFELRLIDGRIV